VALVVVSILASNTAPALEMCSSPWVYHEGKAVLEVCPLDDQELAMMRGGQGVGWPALKATKRKVILWDEGYRPQPRLDAPPSSTHRTNRITLRRSY
jgi:hypothetical protein